jgi:hypothetical protein
MNQRPILTILTNTIPPKKRYFLKTARLLKRLFLGKRPLIDRYEGHSAVTRSVLVGLSNSGVLFNCNPSAFDDIAATLFVLSDLDAFRQAIDLKKRGRIQKLFAGPNLLIDPSDEKELMSSPELDGFLVPSDWVRDFYITEIPELSGKCHVWPAGVDIKRWESKHCDRGHQRVLIYDKSDHDQPIHEYQKFLEERGWESSVIQYGSYKNEHFLQSLRKSHLALFFSPSESQGIALLESWAADVPTFVWDRGWAFLKKTNKKIPASSAPYLNPHLGEFFSDLSSFKAAFQKWETERSLFRPREWVCAHLSDEACAKKLIKIFGLGTC